MRGDNEPSKDGLLMIYLTNRKPLIRTKLSVREKILPHLCVDNYAENMYSINKFDDFINVTDLDTLQKFLLVGGAAGVKF